MDKLGDTHGTSNSSSYSFCNRRSLHNQGAFEDNVQQVIDFRPILEGDLYDQLQDKKLFDQVEIDAEARTLVWPNGAYFDPATLLDWPAQFESMKSLAKKWASQKSEIR